MKKRRDWAPAAISAAVAAAAVVAIYEGKVYLTRADPGLEAERREAGHPAPDEPVSDRPIDRLELSLKGSPAIPKASAADPAIARRAPLRASGARAGQARGRRT